MGVLLKLISQTGFYAVAVTISAIWQSRLYPLDKDSATPNLLQSTVRRISSAG